MEIKFTKSFFDSLKRMNRRSKWDWKIWNFFRYDVSAGFRNLRRWFKIIWKDRDWDHRFIFDILEHKLRNQAENIGKNGNHVSAERDAEIMMTCARLIEKIKTEYYEMEHTDYHDLGEGDQWLTVVSDRYDEFIAKYPLAAKRAVQYIKDNKDRYTVDHTDKYLVCSVMGKLRHDKARKLLFKIMEDQIERWWD